MYVTFPQKRKLKIEKVELKKRYYIDLEKTTVKVEYKQLLEKEQVIAETTENVNF